MTRMARYCKAYSLSTLQAFPRWGELARTDLVPPSTDDEEPYLFLHDDLTVTTDVFPDEGVVFDAVGPEWESFCQTTLEFEVPEECRAIDESAGPSAPSGGESDRQAPAPDLGGAD
jgi:hypothetical protein